MWLWGSQGRARGGGDNYSPYVQIETLHQSVSLELIARSQLEKDKINGARTTVETYIINYTGCFT